MDTKQAQKLIQKYIDGECNAGEKALFESWYNQAVQDRPDPMIEPDYKALQQRLAVSLPAGKKTVRLRLWPRIAAVAAAVTLIVLGVYFFNAPFRHLDTSSSRTAGRDLLNDIAPGKNGATITLANGKVIQLSDAKSGVIIGDDRLAYNDGSSPLSSRANAKDLDEDLTASTTKGQTYIFTLPDGTKVWLNAASSLTIPSGFSGTESRRVELRGEAYFEVFKDKKRPFIVKSSGQEVTVLGTHFNINSYADEGMTKTTLLEGSVRVASLSSIANAKDLNNVILRPNQQASLNTNNTIKVQDVNAADALAWKNGEFVFNDEPLHDIMRRVARWYDVEVVYEGVDKTKLFNGTISRFEHISKVLDILQATGKVKFKIEGRKVIVTK